MKQRKQRGLALVLAAVLMLVMAGCGGSGGDGQTQGNTRKDSDTNVAAKGRYMEKELQKPENFQGQGKFTFMLDGSIVLMDFENGIKNISTDEGETWIGEEIPEVQKLVNEVGYIQGAMAPDGGILCAYVNWDIPVEGQIYAERYMYIAPDGTKEEFELGLENYRTMLQQAVFAPDGQLFIYVNSGNIYEVNLENQTAKLLLQPENGTDFSMYAGKTALIVQDGKKVYTYDYESGQVSTEDSVLNTFIAEQTNQKTGVAMCSAMAENENSSLYFAAAGGIYRHVAGGSVMELLSDGALSNLSDPSYIPVCMLQAQEQKFLVLYQNGEIYSYEFDPEASVVPEEQITIYSLYDNETVRRAISVFRKKTPEVYVKFEIGLTGEDSMTESDAIHNLNTRLLAGTGPDLLILDGMPMESYTEKGILADLSGVVKELESENRFFDKILKAYQQDKGIYVLPVRYYVPILGGDRGELENITDLNTLADLAEQIAMRGETETVLGTYTAEELIRRLYPVCAGEWITKDGVDEEALRQFLTAAEKIYRAEQTNLEDQERQEHMDMLQRRVDYYGKKEAEKLELCAGDQTMELLARLQRIAVGYLYSMEDYQSMISYNREEANTSLKAWNAQTANVFGPSSLVGLCSNSQNADTASDFVKTLLQTKVQQMDLGDGFPVNADALEQYTANPEPGSEIGVAFSDKDENMVEFTLYWPEGEELENLEQIIQSLSVPAPADNSVKNDVISIGAKALSGDKKIDESVQEIVQKISLYLQE